MANIVFFPRPSIGHTFPTFKLAKGLKSRGYNVSYLAGDPTRRHIEAQGLTCLPAFSALDQVSDPTRGQRVSSGDLNDFLLKRRAKVVRLLRESMADLLLIDRCVPAMLSIANRERIMSMVLETQLGTPPPARTPELVLSPRELDFPDNAESRQGRYYVESIDCERVEPPFQMRGLHPEKPLVFCALGSQGNSCYTDSASFFETVLRVMAHRPEWQMVLAIGPGLELGRFSSPPNVLLVQWASQLTVLKRASVMITHGGLGTIKECIISGVPMIVLPLVNDEPKNAARVVYHGLGLRADKRNLSGPGLESMIERAVDDDLLKSRVASMRARFLETEESGRGVRIVERVLTRVRSSSLERREVRVWLT